MSPDELLPDESPSTRGNSRMRRFALLVLASALVSGAAMVLTLGIEATPYDTADRAGRTMGFNDPLNAEHFAIILRHFRVADFLRVEHVYDGLLLAMHTLGAGLLLAAPLVTRRTLRGFFGVQVLLFPFGLLLCWLPIVIALSLFNQPIDREFFTDGPPPFIYAQTTWDFASLAIVFALRRKGSGSLGRGLREFLSKARRRTTGGPG